MEMPEKHKTVLRFKPETSTFRFTSEIIEVLGGPKVGRDGGFSESYRAPGVKCESCGGAATWPCDGVAVVVRQQSDMAMVRCGSAVVSSAVAWECGRRDSVVVWSVMTCAVVLSQFEPLLLTSTQVGSL